MIRTQEKKKVADIQVNYMENLWKCHEIVRRSESAETTTWDPLSDLCCFLGKMYVSELETSLT